MLGYALRGFGAALARDRLRNQVATWVPMTLAIAMAERVSAGMVFWASSG